MKIEENDVLTLSDNNEYLVVALVEYQEIKYAYLIDVNDKKVMVCSYIDDDFEIVSDQDILKEVIPLFQEKLKDIED